MKVTARVERSHAFVLRPVDATAIWSILFDSIGPVEATARCADDIKREFDSVDALTQYENVRGRAIRSLSFRARSKNWDTYAYLCLEPEFSSSIDLHVEGPEVPVLNVRDRISELAVEMKPWYSFLSRINFFYVIGGIFVFLMSVFGIMSGGTKIERTISFYEAILAAVVSFAVIAVLGALIWGLNRIRKWFFPIATFAIGRGQERYDFDERIRWVVIVGFIVSAFASLVVAFLLRAA